MSSVADEEVVHIDLPAISGRLRLVRLAVAGLATEHGADVDDLEDVRMATGEICTHLVGAARPGDRLIVEIRVSGDVATGGPATLAVIARIDGLTNPGPLDELSEMVLATTAGAHGIDRDDSASSAWFRREIRSVPEPAVEGGRSHDD